MCDGIKSSTAQLPVGSLSYYGKFLIKVSRRMFYLVTVINRSLSLVLTFRIWTFNMSLHKQVNKSPLPPFFKAKRIHPSLQADYRLK